VDGKDFASPGRILLVATGVSHNKGATLESRGGTRVTYGNRWGEEPVMCEGIPADVTLPAEAARVALYPLDERGDRRGAVPTESREGKAVLRLGPEHKTVWYEVEVR
jgi:hypothetical protein